MLTVLISLFFAQGVTSDAIVIGMEGHAESFSVDQENLGMRLVIQQVNAGGGIHGRRLVEKSYPRGKSNTPDRQIANVRRLVQDDLVFLLFNFGGPGSIPIGAYAMKQEIPYLFPHTALLTVDGERHVYTSYPRYDGESRVMLRYLAEDRDVERIAIIYADNIYGRYFADRARELASEFAYAVVGALALPRNPTDAVSEMKALQESRPDAVIMALYPAGARKVVQAKAALDWEVRLVSSGPLTDEQYLNVDGGEAEGTLGFCYYPDPNVSDAAGVVEYRRLMAKYYPGEALNRYSLYGYVFGKLVVEGLERAGPELSRERFLDGMESIRDWDSGGIMPAVSFSASNHHAQSAGFICELRDGRFEALTGWITP
jgi:ABC-type branched-subunit amino acid transport system substrate-binding protein